MALMNGLTSRPLYLQLRVALAERIAKGEWKAGGAIPNESDLAREFGVSPGTMRKALDLLESDRLVTRKQGRGTFVNDQTSDDLAIRFNNIRCDNGKRLNGHADSAEATEGKANELECLRLGLRPYDSVYRIRRIRLHDSLPFMLEEMSLPAALFPGLATGESPTQAIVVLALQYGLLVSKAEERVSLRTASPAVALALNIAPCSPVMVLDRVVMTLDGRPIEWRVGHCHLVEHHYLVEMS